MTYNEDLELFGDASEKAQSHRRARQYKERIPCGNCGHVHLGICLTCNACEQIVPPKPSEELANESYMNMQLTEQIKSLMPLAQRCAYAENRLRIIENAIRELLKVVNEK